MRSRQYRRRGITDSRTVRVAAAVAVLAATGALTATFVSSGGKGTADAATTPGQFLAIDQVAPNVVTPPAGPDASAGRFTVDCGTNGNGKFSPDNPVAQPGIKNGAEHLHDFVGNLAITADSSDADLDASGTTCRNGDKSSYFWPVVRIDRTAPAATNQVREALADTSPTVVCPSVRDRLPAVPAGAKAAVDRQLAALDQMEVTADQRVFATRGVNVQLNNLVLQWLRTRRAAAIRQLTGTIGARSGTRPAAMVSLADCDVSYDGIHAARPSAGHHDAHSGGAGAPAAATPQVSCPSVRNRLPGVPPPALAEVNRDLTELDRQISEADQRLVATRGQGGANFVDNAVLGPLAAKRTAVLDRIATAIGRTASVLIEYRGNATSKVIAMPKFLRELTGDAKPTSRGPANARATWTCSGFTDRLSDKYPICPRGRQVQRVQDFPGCWDGRNLDSANHRDQVAFADRTTGACPAGFVAIPQLRITISYDIPRDVQLKGQFALDSFPEENHNPFSDHNDFVNVNSARTMQRIATCINKGQNCR